MAGDVSYRVEWYENKVSHMELDYKDFNNEAVVLGFICSYILSKPLDRKLIRVLELNLVKLEIKEMIIYLSENQIHLRYANILD